MKIQFLARSACSWHYREETSLREQLDREYSHQKEDICIFKVSGIARHKKTQMQWD